MRLEHFFTLYTKINSKWFKDLNERPETTKLLEGNIGKMLFDVNGSKIYIYIFYLSPKAKEIKIKINRWDLIKFFKNVIKIFFVSIMVYYKILNIVPCAIQ